MNPIDIGSTLANLMLAIFIMHYTSVMFKEWCYNSQQNGYRAITAAQEVTKQMEIASLAAKVPAPVCMDCLKTHVGKPVLVVDNEPLPSEAAAEK